MKKAKEELKNKGIRFPVSLLDAIDRLAEQEHRTFTEQVLYFCEKGIQRVKAEEDDLHPPGRGTGDKAV